MCSRVCAHLEDSVPITQSVARKPFLQKANSKYFRSGGRRALSQAFSSAFAA